jgi:hypothetical protein
MISKSTLSALAVVGLGVAGLGVAAWNQPSQAQGQQTAVERPRAAASAPGETDEARRQAKNLRDILLASANYASQSNCYPPPAIYGDGDRPLLSWRVAILPFLGQNELYQQFRLNEPWDSPHNKALIGKMPAVFETPASPTPKGYTRFRGFAGKGTVFDPTPNPDAGAMGYGGMMGGMGAAMGGMEDMSGRGQAEMMAGMMSGMRGYGEMMRTRRGQGATAEKEKAAKKGTDKRRVAQAEEAESHRRETPSRLAGNDEPEGPRGAGLRADRPEERPRPAAPAGSEGAMGGMMGMGSAMGPASIRRGVQVAEITDGTANTIFAVVARDATPWTKPGELPFVPDQELPALDDHDPRGYMLGMCHGNVRLLKKDHPNLPMILAALITRSFGEIVSADVFADEARPTAGSVPGSLERSPTTAPASSVEERLRAVEEKLDRLIERLDAR